METARLVASEEGLLLLWFALCIMVAALAGRLASSGQRTYPYGFLLRPLSLLSTHIGSAADSKLQIINTLERVEELDFNQLWCRFEFLLHSKTFLSILINKKVIFKFILVY